ncbi:phosphate ABC transporter permease subunit PstC [Alcanivorax sp. 24]|uniref:phosphate ABC transporter permease subunit PstC n=1 Tax=Alcanivorax sp. 24 TaxID=2545266 RepID=UPI001061B895|nr:phosphate ABC transporter permease subunit PstC [Alcanivorax sp. 24]
MITTSWPRSPDYWLLWLLRLAGGAVALVLGGIVLVLVAQSLPFLVRHGATLWQGQWQPAQEQYGMASMVAGSLVVSVLALAIAAPVSVLLAAWLRYFMPALRRPVLVVVELMAGIPSVVYGLWGMLMVVPLINQWVPPGASWLAGSLVLALMILPLALLVTDTALEQLPGHYVRSAQALALSRVGMLRRVLLPQALPAIVSGLVLQFGRAMGETMAVLMVSGNVVQWPTSVFDPLRTLTANIALEMAYATGDHRLSLFVSGLLLLLVTLVLLLLSWRLRRGGYGLA